MTGRTRLLIKTQRCIGPPSEHTYTRDKRRPQQNLWVYPGIPDQILLSVRDACTVITSQWISEGWLIKAVHVYNGFDVKTTIHGLCRQQSAAERTNTRSESAYRRSGSQ